MIEMIRYKPVLVSWSGGKDSMLALDRLLDDAALRVVGLLTTVTGGYDRVSIHGIRRGILHRQAACLGLEVVEVEIPPATSNANYEQAFAAGLALAQTKWPGLSTIAFGDLYLQDVRAYREALLARLGWDGLYPIWGEDTSQLARAFFDRGFRAILTCVDTTQLDARFAGREFDPALLAELPAGVDPCGERGEFHTCVYAGPRFKNAIPLRTGERVLRDERFQYCDLIEM